VSSFLGIAPKDKSVPSGPLIERLLDVNVRFLRVSLINVSQKAAHVFSQCLRISGAYVLDSCSHFIAPSAQRSANKTAACISRYTSRRPQ
jgi:hypothetical protein